MTTAFVNGKKKPAIISILREENYLSPEYRKVAHALADHYHPIELDPKIPMLEKKQKMHDICRQDKVMLLSFDLTKKDKAYIVERAHMERELYRDSKRQGPSTTRTMNEACEKYWGSRVPAFDYDGSYSVPQLAIWKPIPFKRLKVEWIKPHDEVWEEALKKDPSRPN